MQRFVAYGTLFGLRATTTALATQACAALPIGWHPAPDVAPAGIIWYDLDEVERGDGYALSCDREPLGTYRTPVDLISAFAQHAELLMAERATTHLFVHAGVVSWQGQAILIPGRSFSGKTTLVKALLDAGAVYYSDEFAILDPHGLVHPYPRPLAVRTPDGQPLPPIPVEALGGRSGRDPLPVGLIVVTHYAPSAQWQPQLITPGQALLAVMDNTVAARRSPAHSMPILRQVVMHASAVQSPRGESSATAALIISSMGH